MSNMNPGKKLINHHGLEKVMNQLEITHFPNHYGYCFNCEELQQLPADKSGKCMNCPEVICLLGILALVYRCYFLKCIRKKMKTKPINLNKIIT